MSDLYDTIWEGNLPVVVCILHNVIEGRWEAAWYAMVLIFGCANTVVRVSRGPRIEVNRRVW